MQPDSEDNIHFGHSRLPLRVSVYVCVCAHVCVCLCVCVCVYCTVQLQGDVCAAFDIKSPTISIDTLCNDSRHLHSAFAETHWHREGLYPPIQSDLSAGACSHCTQRRGAQLTHTAAAGCLFFKVSFICLSVSIKLFLVALSHLSFPYPLFLLCTSKLCFRCNSLI